VRETEVATVAGMGIDGRDRVSRARDPIVEEAERRSDAVWTRVRVCKRRGSEGGDAGVPKRARSWLEKVVMGLRSDSLERWEGFAGAVVVDARGGLRIATPPHCGMSQLVARFSLMIRGD
jgi:hypothetical protein